jgi:RNA polymerase sigma factor (sigma-70 family)
MAPDTEKPDPLPDAPASPEHLERVAETFDREYPRLLRWLLQKAPREDAKEILSEAFTQLVEQRDTAVSWMLAYVRKIVNNLLKNYYRDKAARRSKLVLLELEDSERVPSPESALIEQQRRDRLKHVIAHQEPRLRLALQLRNEGRSHKEIAAYFAAEGIPITERTVQRYLKQVYEICRQELETSEEPKKERTE